MQQLRCLNCERECRRLGDKAKPCLTAFPYPGTSACLTCSRNKRRNCNFKTEGELERDLAKQRVLEFPCRLFDTYAHLAQLCDIRHLLHSQPSVEAVATAIDALDAIDKTLRDQTTGALVPIAQQIDIWLHRGLPHHTAKGCHDLLRERLSGGKDVLGDCGIPCISWLVRTDAPSTFLTIVDLRRECTANAGEDTANAEAGIASHDVARSEGESEWPNNATTGRLLIAISTYCKSSTRRKRP
jgi:hypothetical protein